jgi:glycosyltransferase involved in cell wall biosynthesis
MLVSVVIPACEAQATIGRAIRSVIAQTYGDWEAIVVSDDRTDYESQLRRLGLTDARLRFVSTEGVRTGCHHARNVGLAAARGDLIAALDADDLFYPRRLEMLAPLASAHGAAADNVVAVSDESGDFLYRVLGEPSAPVLLDAAQFLALSIPLFPVVQRQHAEPRLRGIEYAEDVVANIRLIDRLGMLTVIPETLSEYRVIAGSMSHENRSAETFEESYGALIERLQHGDGLALSSAIRSAVLQGLTRKREFNRAFGGARRIDPRLNFHTFAAAHGAERRT